MQNLCEFIKEIIKSFILKPSECSNLGKIGVVAKIFDPQMKRSRYVIATHRRHYNPIHLRQKRERERQPKRFFELLPSL